MKNKLLFYLLFTLSISLQISCKTNQDNNFANIIEVKSNIHSCFLDKDGSEYLKIENSLFNNSKDTVELFFWSCGWPDYQTVIKPNIFDIPFYGCDKNYIKSIIIEPLGTLDLILTLKAKENLRQINNIDFQIGFLCFQNRSSLHSFSNEYPKNSSIDLIKQFEGHIYWSNSVKIDKKWLNPNYKADIIFEMHN